MKKKYENIINIKVKIFTSAVHLSAAIVHGIPRPRNTLTPLLPVTLPIELSACSSCLAACILANKSGKLVPSATNVMAVTVGFRPIKHPKMDAKSPTMAVRIPIIVKDTKKASQPPQI